MRVALVNPPWTFEGSIYFGCREPHLPLEYGYTRALLEQAGYEVQIIDGQLDTPVDAATGHDAANHICLWNSATAGRCWSGMGTRCCCWTAT